MILPKEDERKTAAVPNQGEVLEYACAKINLWLAITGKREDGYHTLRTVMCSTGLYDQLYFRAADEFSLTCSDDRLSCGEDNLCARAERAYRAAFPSSVKAEIHLQKNIPMQAGLGGGSADAAAVLRGMNRINGNPLSEKELLSIAIKLGADVPFCLLGGTKLCLGIGEEMSDYPALPPCYLLITAGIGQVSTKEAYRLIDTLPEEEHPAFSDFDRAMRAGDLSAIGRNLYNRFEASLPVCRRIKDMLSSAGACGALLSGSGSAVYGLFADQKQAESAAAKISGEGIACYLSRL